MSRTVPVLLASTSPYRRELLARLGIAFEAVAPGVDEEPRAGELPVDRALRLAHEKAASVAARHPDDQRPSAGELPVDRALRLAHEKAASVAARHPEALVIGSDQVAACADTVLEKPGDAARSREQLALLSGRSARFYTACAVLAPRTGPHLAHVDTTTVTFRRLTDGEIARYVERERPYDCAGAFKAESLGVTLLEAIETADPTALIGLPLIWLAGALRSAGCALP